MMLKQLILCCVMLVSLAGTGFAAQSSHDPQGHGAQTAPKLDLNKADQHKLQVLPNVGPTVAKRIIQYRQQHGDFKSVKQLKNIKGVGQKTLQDLKQLVRVGS